MTEKANTLQDNREEVKDLSDFLKQKPEIYRKVDYYKSILRANDMLIESIEDRLSRGSETRIVRFLFAIPFTVTRRISDYERAKLLAEKIEIEDKVYYQKKYFEDWLQRRNEYEMYFDKLSAECNERFDELYERAKHQATISPRLTKAMENYSKASSTDQETKNTFYLFMRQEVKGGRVPQSAKA